MVEKRVIGDSIDVLAATIRELLEQVDVVVLTGGLGPTADDITREAVARALDLDLAHDPEVERWIRERYSKFDRPMRDMFLRMAKVIEGSRPLPNNRGSAPGVLLRHHGKLLAAFPGVQWEMEEMLERDLAPELARLNPGVRRLTRTLLLGGVFESDVEERIKHLYDRFGRESVTILAKCGVVRLILSAEGDQTDALSRINEMQAAFVEPLSEDLAGVDVGGLEEVVLAMLRRRGESLAVAESCTGGMLSSGITDVPGASDVFLGGVVSYSNEAKENIVGVPSDELVNHGAVSEHVARSMASGARERFDANWGMGITGVAGPGGGTDEKPVGLVHWAVASSSGVESAHRKFPGNREVVRRWSVNSALDHLRRCLQGGDLE
jgi:nicotinamide-nucleotide amidase